MMSEDISRLFCFFIVRYRFITVNINVEYWRSIKFENTHLFIDPSDLALALFGLVPSPLIYAPDSCLQHILNMIQINS